MRNVPFGKPAFDEREKKAVLEVLDSGWLAHGPKTHEFEKNFAQFCGAKFAVAMNSCTAAIHISMVAAGIGKGDEIIIPAQTHVATGHAALYADATPVFADVDVDTYNIDLESIKKAITDKTKAIVPVHFAGQPCRMDEIYSLAEKNNLLVIEDAAHALDASYKGKKIGSLEGSCAANFSFYPVKHITTGEGGVLATNDEKIAEKASLLRAFGIDRSTWKRTTTERPWYYEVQDLGFNFRMMEMSAALGLIQLEKAKEFGKIRNRNFKLYEKLLKGIEGVSLPRGDSNTSHAHLFYQVLINEESKMERDDLIGALKGKGVGVSVHYPLPVPLMPIYKKLYGFKEGMFPNAERVAKRAISLPVHQSLTEEDIEYVCEQLISFVG